MKIIIKSRNRKRIKRNFLTIHEDAQDAYNFISKSKKQFQTCLLPNEIKNILLSFNNIYVLKNKEEDYYKMICGFRYSALLNKDLKDIYVNVINDELSTVQIQYISWIDVVENLLSSWKHNIILGQCLELFETLPNEIYTLINSEAKKRKPNPLVELLSQETRNIVRNQVKKYKNTSNNTIQEQDTFPTTNDFDEKSTLVSQIIKLLDK